MLTIESMQAFIEAYAARLEELCAVLDDLDNRIGDGDHGTNMARGFRTAADRTASGTFQDLGALCQTVAMALLSSVGGASGPLYATAFMRFAQSWNVCTHVDYAKLATGVAAALEGLRARGKAEVGEKTMIDVWTPAADAIAAHPDETGLREAVSRATNAALATRDIAATKGRAAYLGARSVGTCDPGSISSAMFFEELADAIAGGVTKTTWQTSAL
ncbi:dihydroxyacetone kinase DhaL subunit [Alicyclobacillus sacchari]|uniref:phosphoenolpyruvate--glycerone phosphotransferase n=1 Tax=Alicyclobacillus sacchari TaxID=392010 RepID=A0A4V3HES8_9BACL|nr:dihydroxyacetone kinase subunit DhaL [Alicyclobacillus sacchari]TDY50141.1 dihydroxyacetone kinase DhaL subunit [Alicyclobacillus sacchari]GMA57489.1 dihydroxyacetone kinase subunit L [Alicyclobacillus sacchari]